MLSQHLRHVEKEKTLQVMGMAIWNLFVYVCVRDHRWYPYDPQVTDRCGGGGGGGGAYMCECVVVYVCVSTVIVYVCVSLYIYMCDIAYVFHCLSLCVCVGGLDARIIFHNSKLKRVNVHFIF